MTRLRTGSRTADRWSPTTGLLCLRDANYGYGGFYVDRDDYNNTSARLRRGYEDGYGDRSQYGRFTDDGDNLDAVLASISTSGDSLAIRAGRHDSALLQRFLDADQRFSCRSASAETSLLMMTLSIREPPASTLQLIR